MLARRSDRVGWYQPRSDILSTPELPFESERITPLLDSQSEVVFACETLDRKGQYRLNGTQYAVSKSFPNFCVQLFDLPLHSNSSKLSQARPT